MPARAITTEEQKVIYAAYERGVSACMDQAGFEWNVNASNYQPPEPDPFPPLDEMRRSGYGADFDAVLKSRKENSDAAANDPVRAVPEAQQATFQAKFNECDAELIETIYGSQKNVQWLSDIGGVGSPHYLSTQQQENPDYVAAMRKWQQCMRDRGVTWMDGTAAWEGWDSGYWVLDSKAIDDGAAPAPEAEIAITNDDADCQIATGLDKIRAQILPRIKEKMWEGQKFSEADKWRFQQWALANAKKVP